MLVNLDELKLSEPQAKMVDDLARLPKQVGNNVFVVFNKVSRKYEVRTYTDKPFFRHQVVHLKLNGTVVKSLIQKGLLVPTRIGLGTVPGMTELALHPQLAQ